MTWTESHPSQYGSYNLSQLHTDEAFINFSSTFNDVLWLYELSTNCLTCPYKLVTPVQPGNESVQIISTIFPTKYRFRTTNNTYAPEEGDSHKFCDVTQNFGEFGIYEITASGTIESPQCHLNVMLEPVNVYLPILLVFLVLILGRIILWIINNYNKIRSKFSSKHLPRKDSVTNLSPPTSSRQQSPLPTGSENQRKRLNSLDTFRGICIMLMIAVHDGGAKYFFMQHATWDGLHVADIIFPWFLCILGVCIPISIKSQLRKKIEKKEIIRKIAIRALKLVILGLMLSTIGGQATDLRHYRIFGVLQRLGISYFLCSILTLYCLKDQFQSQEYNHFLRTSTMVIGKWGIFLKHVKDITVIWKGWLVILTLVAVQTCLVFFLPVPNCPTGYLGPGGLHNNNGQPTHCIGGATGYIDRKIWGNNIIYHWPTANEVYNGDDGVPYDPEGTLGYFTSLLQCWFGVQLGLTFVFYDISSINVLARLSVWTIFQGILGGFLCGWKHTGGFIPINKNLWSISFVLVTNALGGILLGFLYVVNDILEIWNGSPFIQPGLNSIFLYVIHLTVQKMAPWHWAYDNMDNGHFIPLVELIWGLSLWILLAIWLKRKKIFVKL